MKTRQDNIMTNQTSVVYAENDNELSWSIGSGADYDENQIGQLHDWSHKCGLCWKWN